VTPYIVLLVVCTLAGIATGFGFKALLVRRDTCDWCDKRKADGSELCERHTRDKEFEDMYRGVKW